MEFHIGQNRIVLFPEDMRRDARRQSKTRYSHRIPQRETRPRRRSRVVDKIVCLKVKIIKRKVEEKYLIITNPKGFADRFWSLFRRS